MFKSARNRNFLDAVRSRNRADLAADIEEGHVSAAQPLLAREYREPFAVPASV